MQRLETLDIYASYRNTKYTNEQQVVTVHHCIPHIRDQGLLIVEDTHTSYLGQFGNPSRHSFINSPSG